MRFAMRAGLTMLGLALAVPALAGEPAPIGGVKLIQPVSFPVLPDFRVRLVVPPSEPNWRMLGPQSLAKHGGGALVDFFPFDEHFHLSAGGRLFNRAGGRVSDPASLQILSARAMPGGLRQQRRFTPTMLMGYSIDGARGMALGLDAGVMVGRSSPGPDLRLNRGDGLRSPGGVNGLARMTVKYPF